VQSGEAAVHNTSSAGADIRISQQDRPQFRLIETLKRPIATGDGDEHPTCGGVREREDTPVAQGLSPARAAALLNDSTPPGRMRIVSRICG
jgi:hypothetical protein